VSTVWCITGYPVHTYFVKTWTVAKPAHNSQYINIYSGPLYNRINWIASVMIWCWNAMLLTILIFGILNLLRVLFVSLHLRFVMCCQSMYNLVGQFMFLNQDSKLFFLTLNLYNWVNRRGLIERAPLHLRIYGAI